MKKVFLLSLGLVIGLCGFAQEKANMKSNVAKQSVITNVMDGYENATPAQFAPTTVRPMVSTCNVVRNGEVAYEDWDAMMTDYDLQSNSAVGNRITVWNDGTAAVVATWNNPDVASYGVRGTGYNYYDGSSFGDYPEDRIEGSIYSGWPSICAYGDGEIVASHGGGNVNIFYRATKGTGTWTKISTIEGWTWPRVACTADGTLHVICAEQSSSNNLINYISYWKSTDGGNSWTQDEYFTNLSAEYNYLIGADDYVFAVNGNTIAVMFNSMTYDVFYVISTDGGNTWEKKVVASFPLGVFDWNQTAVTSDTDSIYWNDNSGSIAIGNDGTVHLAWGLGRWAPAPSSGAGHYSYWPYTVSIVYWNSNYTNEQGGNTILPFGEWSGDAEHPEWALNGTNGRSSTMNYDRLIYMTWGEYLNTGDPADINPNFNVFGWASEKTPGSVADWTENWDNSWGTYRSLGISTMPAVSVDDNNNVMIMFSSLSDDRVDGINGFYYRSAFIHQRIDGVWNGPNDEYSLTSADFMHSDDEVYPLFGYSNAVDGSHWFGYSADDMQGLYLDDNQSALSNNIIYACKIEGATVDVNETKDVVYNIYPNPATDYICISAEAAAEATVSFVNLAGQTVKVINKSLTIGDNSISINLESGVYFCTVTANGFSKTTKVVVK